MPSFLEDRWLLAGGPHRFNIAIERLLLHLGFDDIRLIDGPGDQGGDILAARGSELFVLQNKWTTGSSISKDAVDEVERAMAKYGADRAVVVTNARPNGGATKRATALGRVGVKVEFWTGEHLRRLYQAIPGDVPTKFKLRPYQLEAADRMNRDLASRRRALLVLATGLGKTVVAGEVIRSLLTDQMDAQVLVVAHTKDLVRQLERALWRHLPKTVRTQVITGDDGAHSLEGVTCATVEAALKEAEAGYRPAMVMIDETHHVGEEGRFSELLDELEEALQFGVTATPWRGDGFRITERFGEPSFKMGIAEGMAQGYLAQVDYRLFVDDLDWDFVRSASKLGYSVKELNSKLFLPQRDEVVLERLWEVWQETASPRGIVFCRTIEHATRMASLMSRFMPAWKKATCLHSGNTKRERDALLAQFRTGRVPVLTAVDVLNEGVDVPDVNIITFLRVTHSRRIFVQQLGRGLRIREGKDRVRVLDFVTDVRRIAAVVNLRRDLDSLRPKETLLLEDESYVRFSDEKVGSLMDAWLKDAASLETALEESRLQFPEELVPTK